MVYDDVITPSKACFLYSCVCVCTGTFAHSRGRTRVNDNLGRSVPGVQLANGARYVKITVPTINTDCEWLVSHP